jgi:protein O-GlcNAc transferase
MDRPLNRPAEAFERLSQVLRSNPSDAETWNRRGLVLCALGRFDDASRDFGRAVELNPRYAEALCNRGKALATLGRLREALAAFDGALALEPNLADAWYCRGNTCQGLNRYDEARSAFDKALALRPDFAEAVLGRGNVCYALKQFGDAIAAYDEAIARNPGYAEAINNRATALLDLGRHRDAISGFEKALQLRPDFADAWLGLGGACYELPEFEKAGAAYERALGLNPRLVKAWIGQGNVLARGKQYQQALAAFDQALALDPHYAEVWIGRAEVLEAMRRFDEAIVACDRALAINPALGYGAGTRLNLKLLSCDWTNLKDETAQLVEGTRRQASFDLQADASSDARIGIGKIAQPLVLARLIDDAAVLQASAVNWIRVYASCPTPFVHAPRPRAGKPRLGYLSQDFRQHVTGRGFVEMFEKHDTSRFDLYGISLAPDDGSAVRKRIEAAFGQFHDVSALGDEAAARRIRELAIDVIVEMVPLSDGSRPAILAHRPAPIQVNGWSAGYSTGAPHLDYVLGDAVTLPFSDQPFYTEKIVHLPHTCFGYDSTQVANPRVPDRAEEGLPQDGFVFCSFNTSYKILPEFFAIWMRLLHRVEGSVLWLARNNDFSAANLRRAASEAGIDPKRLVFAQVRPAIEDHLARHRLADLALDTLPYNAQSTAMDALWAGVPILTCAGRSFCGRLAMSQLQSISLPELIAEDVRAYEELAVALAREPERLKQIRRKLERNRLTSPLFDTARLCRELEAAYETMMEIWHRGEKPRSFAVKAD